MNDWCCFVKGDPLDRLVVEWLLGVEMKVVIHANRTFAGIAEKAVVIT